jgi:TolB-like protein
MNHDIFERPVGVFLTQDPSSLKGMIMKVRWVVLLLVFTLLVPPFSISQPQVSIKEYQVAILPFLIHSQENIDYLREGIYDILFSRIGAEGRIAMIDRTAVERALYEERPLRLDEEAAKKIGLRVGADYVVFGSLTKIGNYISLDARMVSVTEDKPPLTAFTQHQGLDDVMVKIGDFGTEIGMKITGRRPTAGRAPAPGQKRSAIIMSREGVLDQGVTKSQTFPFEVKGMDVGDVDGDKKNELVVMDSNNLYIFKYNGERLTLFQKLEMEPGNTFLTLDVANVNRRGPAEIIVTNMVDDNLRSFILEFEEGKFKKIHEKTGWFFRVLEHPKEGPVLMGQAMDAYGMIAGPIYRLVWKKTTFEQGPKLPFPPDTKLFGLALIETKTPGVPDVVIVDESSRLRLLGPRGNYTWSSPDPLGGTENFYETKKKKIETLQGPGESPTTFRVYIPGRILVRDLDGDGINELIINRNISGFGTAMFERIRNFDKSEVVNMVWDENSFLKMWHTREMDGYIADYQIRDVDNDGLDELVVALVNRSDVFDRKRTSTIYFFELP